ncbi:hypothetical protein CgunFtcFv8_003706 [Champsocephalus gunnari]|uniref:Uncharacterized protein n=1 Tax=Champsocephalus gunnari TaxID=52237 RepID=A0AAN8DZ90_CHAGU|nr:hypothetical protein CgunFtcFv8_003706 [Champsocephalus gunnari]
MKCFQIKTTQTVKEGEEGRRKRAQLKGKEHEGLKHHWELLSDAEAVPRLNTVEPSSWKQGGKAGSS